MSQNNKLFFETKAKSIKVVLNLRNGQLRATTEKISLKFDEFDIKIEFMGNEIITISHSKEVCIYRLWGLFLTIHRLQQLGIGYFYDIEKITLFDSNSVELKDNITLNVISQIINEPNKNTKPDEQTLLHFYVTSIDWIHPKLNLIDISTLVNEKNLNKFNDICNEINIIHIASLVHCANTGINVDMQCGGIIQLFENLGKYIANIDGKENCRNDEDGPNLSKSIKYLIKKYNAFSFLNCEECIDDFAKKAANTRNRIMHYDIKMNVNKYFSPSECNMYARILQIFYRYIILRRMDIDTTIKANENIQAWKNWNGGHP